MCAISTQELEPVMAMFINGDAFDAEFDVDMTKPLLEQLECSFL